MNQHNKVWSVSAECCEGRIEHDVHAPDREAAIASFKMLRNLADVEEKVETIVGHPQRQPASQFMAIMK